MLTDEELERLCFGMESDRVERKRSLTDLEKIREAICAFANDLAGHGKPGVVCVGLNDDGTCADFRVTDEALLTLASMRSDGNILPLPVMTVEKKRLRDCDLAVVQVTPSQNPPVRFKGRTCVRVGPRRGVASPEEERRLNEKRRWGDLPFDQQPVIGSTLDDLNLNDFRREYLPAAVAPEILEANHREIADQLAVLHFLSRDATPTPTGLIAFGKDLLYWIPGAYIQFLRIDGESLADPIRHACRAAGPLSQQIFGLETTLRANISVAMDITGRPTHLERPDYPMAALQQLCRNAVLHRTYEGTNAPVRVYWFLDRIEIYSPGGLYGSVNRDNFGHGAADYRNPHLAEVMKTLGFIEKFGVGIAIAKNALEKNGNPPPEFQFEATSVLVTVRPAR